MLLIEGALSYQDSEVPELLKTYDSSKTLGNASFSLNPAGTPKVKKPNGLLGKFQGFGATVLHTFGAQVDP